MKLKTVIFLTVLLAACVVYVIVRSVEWGEPKDETDKYKEKIVFAASNAKAAKLLVTADDGTEIVFDRADNAWRIASPIRAKAVQYKVADIADKMRSLRYERAFTPDDEGAPGSNRTGLDKPRWTVVLEDNAKQLRTLLIGKPVPLSGGDKTYVRVDGDENVYVINVDFASLLERPLREYRDKTIFDFSSNKVVRLKVDGREKFDLVKDIDEKWGIYRPISAGADQDKVDDLVRKVCSLRASDFITDKPGKLSLYGLEAEEALLKVHVWLRLAPPASQPTTTKAVASAPAREQGADFTLLFGGRGQKKNSIYAKLRHEPHIFEVNQSILDDLQPKLLELRDKQVLHFDTDTVTRIHLDVAGGQAELTKEDGRWEMIKPQKGKANAAAIEELLYKIAGLKAANFRDDAMAAKMYKLHEPRGLITLHQAGKSETITLRIGSKSLKGEMAAVMSATGKAVAIVPAKDVEPLLDDPACYWHAELLRLPEGAKIMQLALKRPDGEFALAKELDGSWSLLSPLKAPGDRVNADKLAKALANLTAERIVSISSKAPDKYARAAALIEIEMTVELPAPASWPASPDSQPTTAPGDISVAARPETKPTTTPATQPASEPAPRPVTKTYTIMLARVGDNSYCWVPGRRIVAVGRFGARLYETAIAEIRDRKVLKFKPEEIESFRIVMGEETLELRREAKDKWRCAAEMNVTIDEQKVKRFLRNVGKIMAERFVTHQTTKSEKYGFDKPWLTLLITPAKGKETRLVISNEPAKETEHRYARTDRAPGVFLLPAATIRKLAKSLADFRKQ